MRECINRTKTEAGSIWEVLKRRQLRTFKNKAKTMKVKIQEKVITLREECGLVTRLLILSKSRPGIIEFSELMKKHKFSVTPKSLFDPEGLPLQCTDRACFIKGLEELLKEENTAEERSTVIAVDSDEKISTVIAIDCIGMSISSRLEEETRRCQI